MAQQTAARGGRTRTRQTQGTLVGMKKFLGDAQGQFSRTLRVQSAGQAAMCFAALFVLSFSRLPGGLCPFAAAAFTACLLHALSAPAAFVGCVLATILSFSSQNYLQWWQLSACAAIWLSVPFWRGRNYAFSGGMIACAIACALPAPLLGIQSISQAIISLLSAAASVAMVPVFERAVLTLRDGQRLAGEDDTLCLLLALCAFITGLWSLGMAGKILCGVLCGGMITLCARILPGGIVVMAGAVLGGVIRLIGGTMEIAIFFGGALLSALPSAKDERRRALLFIPGAFVGAALSAVGGMDILWALPAVAGCIAALNVRSTKLLHLARLSPDANSRLSPQASAPSVRTAVTLRIWADQVKLMARQLPHTTADEEGDAAHVEYLAQCLCEGCARKEACWNDRFEITRRYMYKLLGAAEEADPLTVVEQARLLGCVNTEKLEQILYKLRCQSALRREESARAQERKTLTAMQIEGMADVLGGLSEHFYADVKPDDRSFRRAQDELLRRELDAKILYAVSVKERKEMMMIRTGHATVEELRRVADIACGVPMQPSAYETLASTEVLFEQSARLEVNVGVASCKKDGESVAGDGYIARPLSGGRYLLALSDGMGSGEQAHRESQASLHLLWQCLCAGYTRSQALVAVNGILLSCAGTEMFATMDLCLIDLHTGEAAFEKLGACTSYVIRGGELRPICADTLPMGVLAKVEPRSVRMRLEEDDLLVMVSDGIVDSYPEGEQGLRRALLKLRSMPVRGVCDTVLGRALRMRGNIAEDDMTVVCARIGAVQNIW